MEPLVAAALFCTANPAITPQQAVDAYVAAYNAHDAAAMRRTFVEDAVLLMSGEGELDDATMTESVTALTTRVFREFPQARVTVAERLVQGGAVSQRERISGMGQNDGDVMTVFAVHRGCITAMHTLD